MHFQIRICLLLCVALGFDMANAGSIIRVRAESDTLFPQQSRKIDLKALDDNVFIDFKALDNPRLQYAYMLDGYDKNWNISQYPGTRYTNLTGGDYTFKLRVMDGNRVVSEERIPVVVERELQEEWWFVPSIAIYVILLISAAIYFFLLYNFRQKLKLQSMRYKIASDLHDEVGATLSSIAISTRLVGKKIGVNQEVQPILERIKQDSEDTVHTIRDTVWAINPDNDAPEKLFERMRSFAFQLFSAMDIRLDFRNDVPADGKLKLNMEQRRNVFLLFKEAVNNIAKHAGATQVLISIEAKKDMVLLKIEDNGVGFSTDVVYEGNGLKNYKTRAQEGFMDFSIHSAPGEGTKIAVGIPEL